MTKKILFFAGFLLFCIPLFSPESRINVFLTNFFDEKEFSVEEYQYQNDKIYLAYYSKDNNNKSQKIILIKVRESEIEPLIFVNNNKIFNSEKLVFAPVVKGSKFYAWKPEVSIKNDSFRFYATFYTNEGKNVTDPAIFELKNGVFERWFIPKSEL